MIQANELRLGNYFFIGGLDRYVKVSSIFLSHFKCTDENGIDFNNHQYNIKPIELTEEILLKCGFNKIKDNIFEHNFSFYDIELQGNKVAFVLWSEENPAITHFILHSQYLHDFQNAFYLLNDKKELEIEL